MGFAPKHFNFAIRGELANTGREQAQVGRTAPTNM